MKSIVGSEDVLAHMMARSRKVVRIDMETVLLVGSCNINFVDMAFICVKCAIG